MPEVVENKNELRTVSLEKDTWVLALPEETCRREGFAAGTMVSLTFKQGVVQTSVITPSAEAEDFVSRVIAEEGGYLAEMKRHGD
jgi:hypothetical protein